MGYNKPKETTRWHLENAPLPNHGKSYTVISHKTVIESTMKLLSDSGFVIQKSHYRSSMNANVAQGIYYIYPTSTTNDIISTENELGMMFAWTNSYDKSTRFQCAVGGYVKVCFNGMIAGDMMNYKRKHTGSADHDAKMQLSNQIKNAEKYYTRIIQDRNLMKSVALNSKEQAELVGRLFIEEKILDTTQLSCIKNEMHKPTYQYDTTPDTVWSFYNHVTYALKKAHPRDWLNDSQQYHDFSTSLCLNNPQSGIEEEIVSNYDVINPADVNLDDVNSWHNPTVNTDDFDLDITYANEIDIDVDVTSDTVTEIQVKDQFYRGNL
jgi:hypothetical protein